MLEMNSMLSLIAQGKPGGPGSSMLIMFVAMGLLFWFMIIRPQSRQRRQHQQMLTAVKTGDKVLTVGGIYGLVTNVKDDTLTVKIADNVKVEVSRSHISRVILREDNNQQAA